MFSSRIPAQRLNAGVVAASATRKSLPLRLRIDMLLLSCHRLLKHLRACLLVYLGVCLLFFYSLFYSKSRISHINPYHVILYPPFRPAHAE